MPGLSGLALTKEETIEILSLYATSNRPILAVAVEPGWEVIGSLGRFPATADIRLDVTGIVSDSSLVLTTRLYCVSPGFVGEVSGSRVALSSTVDDQAYSSRFTLTGGRVYQVQSQIVGNEGNDYFGYMRRAAPASV
jgi:hypothetical protein